MLKPVWDALSPWMIGIRTAENTTNLATDSSDVLKILDIGAGSGIWASEVHHIL